MVVLILWDDLFWDGHVGILWSADLVSIRLFKMQHHFFGPLFGSTNSQWFGSLSFSLSVRSNHLCWAMAGRRCWSDRTEECKIAVLDVICKHASKLISILNRFCLYNQYQNQLRINSWSHFHSPEALWGVATEPVPITDAAPVTSAASGFNW